MTYSLAVRVTNGTPELASWENLPDGLIEVTGHEDQAAVSIQVSRKDQTGQPVANAFTHQDSEA